jgi:preprotein translocase subunit SecY
LHVSSEKPVSKCAFLKFNLHRYIRGSGNVLSYVDTLTGGSISKLGIFSLGIVPYINSSIIFQLLTSVGAAVPAESSCDP